MLVGDFLASRAQDIAHVKQPLTLFQGATDGVGQPPIARRVRDRGVEQVICLQVPSFAIVIVACREVFRAEFV